jgi:gamma-glutamyl-gamma-aminobutyraldehyde dehydrogenase
VAEQVLERIVDTSAQWFPADPLLPDTKMGPLVDERSLQRVLRHLDRGLAEGAALRVGGQRVLSETGGAYLEPTVVTGAAPNNPIIRDEIFGPVLAVQVVRDEAEAVRIAGDTPYGLAAALWTSDLGTAHRVSRALRAGTVWVNCYEEGDMAVPFGGVKLSGFGRDKSRHALEEYTYLKTTWIRYA